MLSWMQWHTRREKIKNEAIREKKGIAPIENKMSLDHLRWFGHVERRHINVPTMRCEQGLATLLEQGWGRPKKT